LQYSSDGLFNVRRPENLMALLAFFVAYVLIGFVWRSVVVYRRTGKNPLVLPPSDDAYGYVGRAFKLVLAVLGAIVVAHAFAPGVLAHAGDIHWIRSSATFAAGWALLVLSAAWMAVAQVQMGDSWRVGIDAKNPTALVSTGLFAVSRNPIFLSVRVSLLGLLLVLPNALTLSLLAAGEVLMQVQIRLEEHHLQNLHGERYAVYMAKVRRWL